jgi:hypothetical protein
VNANLAMFLSFMIVSLFAFISVAAWTAARGRERKAFYRSEMLKKLLDSPGGGPAAVMEFLRHEEESHERRRGAANRQGGMVVVGVGIALMIGLSQVVRDVPVYLVAGGVPLAVGLMLLLNAFVGRRKP